MSSEQSDRLPFEPASKNRKKSAKNKQTANSTPVSKSESDKERPAGMGIPEAVSKRMIRRMALFCGLPTALGMSTFVVSYLLVSQHWLILPNAAVVFVSMGFFGLGVLGLSYGVLSASWDEEIVGTRLGWNEFSTNWGRMRAAWRSGAKLKAQD